MAQAKKKQATKTAKKQTRSKQTQHRQQGSKCARKTACNNRDRNHIYFVTALGIITAILLCANAAIMSV